VQAAWLRQAANDATPLSMPYAVLADRAAAFGFKVYALGGAEVTSLPPRCRSSSSTADSTPLKYAAQVRLRTRPSSAPRKARALSASASSACSG
jgi:hypothetical protein